MEVSRLSYVDLAAIRASCSSASTPSSGPLSNFFPEGIYRPRRASIAAISSTRIFPPSPIRIQKRRAIATGKLRYGSIDFGYNVYTDKRFRIGVFTGYHYWFENVDANGCRQVGGKSVYLRECRCLTR